MSSPQQTPGFVSSILDLSFNSFITTKIVKLLFIIAVAFNVLYALVVLFWFFSQGAMGILIGLVLAPIVLVVGTILARVWMELIIVVFRIAEDTRTIAQRGDSTPPSSG